MIDLTVKTLDSRNHAFSMPDDATVQQLKAKIEETMNIPANRQRLIFHGRVMQDDKKLSEYEVHGMVIHLVRSQPPQPGSRHGGSTTSNSAGSSDNQNRNSGPRYFGRMDGGTMFGSVVIPVIGDAGGGRHGAWRLMSTADRMIQRASEVLDNHENSASRSASVVPSVTTTPYNSSRDSSGSHSPTTEPFLVGRTASEARANAAPTSSSAQPTTSTGTEGTDTDMDTDSNTATPQITVSSADQTGRSSTSGSAGSSSGTATQEGPGQEPNQQRQQRGTPSATNMAALLARLQALQLRFNPLLARYHSLIAEDAPTNNSQQLAERLVLTQTVPEVLHLLSHAYHAISELTIDWELAPPRQMRPLLAPAIQQLVQLTEGMNPWGLSIPAFGQQPQAAGATTPHAPTTPSSAAAGSATGPSPAASTASTSATASSSASPPLSSTNSGNVPEVTYMTTTFPAEGGEATTTFTTRPAATFETTPGAANAPNGTNAPNRTPVVTASIDFTGRNSGFTAALNAAYAIANRLATHQVGHQHGQPQPQPQPQQQQQQSQQTQQQEQQPPQQQPQPQSQQPQPQSQQPQQGQARGGSIVTLPVGMIDIPNLEFFMEVGPSTITIDSVEATMVTSGGFTPGTNGAAIDGNPLNINFPWGSPPSQEFLHSVVQVLNRIMTTPNANPNMRRRGSAPESTQNPNLQRRGSAPESENAEVNTSSATAAGSTPSASSSPGAPGQTSQARGYTATNPTTSTQTRSTARPHVHHIAAAQFPGYSVGYTDPFLPCHSQFFASWRHSRPSANSGSSTTANNSTQTSGTATPNSHAATSATSQASGSTSNPPSASSSAGFSSGSGSGSASTTASSSNQSQRPGFNNPSSGMSFLTVVETLLGRGSNTSNDALTSALNSLVTTSSQGNQADVPIINWLFPGSHQHEGESLLSDLRLAVVRNVTVSDLVALLESNWNAVNHFRSDLRQFVVQRLCEGSPTEENLERGVNLLMQELRPHFNIILEGTLREDIDAIATLNRFHESFLPDFLKLIVDDEHDSSFGQNLHDLVYKYVGHLWAIVKLCCSNPESIENVLQSCLNRLADENSLATWTARAYLGQLRLYTDSLNVSHQEIEQYIVYRGSAADIASTSSESCSSSETMKMEQRVEEPLTQNSLETVEPMDILDPQSPSEATSSAATVVSAAMDLPTSANSSEEAATAKSSETPGLAAMDTEAPPVPAPEAWHRIVPPEWVPIIARDVTRQRRPNSQPPLSDAYLAGMPPKRRKVVTADKPQGSLSEVISSNMESAIQSSGVSTAGIALVQEEAGSDSRLREAYREQLRATVRANLASNPDFSAERFPNAAQYFGKS